MPRKDIKHPPILALQYRTTRYSDPSFVTREQPLARASLLPRYRLISSAMALIAYSLCHAPTDCTEQQPKSYRYDRFLQTKHHAHHQNPNLQTETDSPCEIGRTVIQDMAS